MLPKELRCSIDLIDFYDIHSKTKRKIKLYIQIWWTPNIIIFNQMNKQNSLKVSKRDDQAIPFLFISFVVNGSMNLFQFLVIFI